MNKQLINVTASAIVCGGSAAFAQDHSFLTDNGVYELSYTVANPEAMIGNYYNTPGDTEMTIDRVEVALGFGQGGRDFEVLLYNDADNDGDPTNATLVSTTVAQIAPDGTNPRVLKLQPVEIEPAAVSGGFFVAVRLADQPFVPPHLTPGWDTAPSAYRLNYNAPFNNWRITGFPSNGPAGGITPIDTADLTNNFVAPVQLNWVIRAFGTADAPAIMTPDMNDDGVHDMRDLMMFLNAFNQNDADFNDDGATNYFDLTLFIAAWQFAA